MIPEITDEIKEKYIIPLEQAFKKKREGYDTISKIKAVVEKSFTNNDVELNI